MAQCVRGSFRGLLMTSVVLMFAVSANASPVYTVNPGSSNSLGLLADFSTNSFALSLGGAVLIDSSAPAVDLLAALPSTPDSFGLTLLDLSENGVITLDFSNRSVGPTSFVVPGLGVPTSTISNLAMIGAMQPLVFTFDLVDFDSQTLQAQYLLNNFQPVSAGEVPEPATMLLAAAGLGCAIMRGRRARSK